MATVLVVDSHPEVVLLLRTVLGQSHDLVVASNGDEAFAMVAANRPSLILLDVRMPGLDGFRVLLRLKSDPGTARLPVIMLTALDEDHDLMLGLSLGADSYVTKPINPRELAILVARQLEVSAV